jgi:preprotein translocase subunit YajC
MNFILSLATSTPAPTSGGLGGGNTWLLLGYIVFFGALMYFLIFLPQKRREKKTKQMLDTLMVGSVVTTIGGMVGTVININEDEVTVESGITKTQVKFKKWAVKDISNPEGLTQ